jgi:lipid-binding SYLF domain-containing protein
MGWKREAHLLSAITWGTLIAVLALVALAGAPMPARADDAQDAQQLVEKARMTFEVFVADKDYQDLLALVKKAKGVLIYPSVLRGAFFFGVSGGNGVLLVHDTEAKQWAGPAFYTIGEVSFGLQAGGNAAEIILVALTDRGVAAFLAPSGKLGVDTGITVGPIGVGASAATQNLSADIISFARSKGLYAGVSVQGAIVGTRGSLNNAYYGQDVTPADILIKRTVTNPQAAALIEAVAKYADAP